MSAQINEEMNEWVNEWMNEWMKLILFCHFCKQLKVLNKQLISPDLSVATLYDILLLCFLPAELPAVADYSTPCAFAADLDVQLQGNLQKRC